MPLTPSSIIIISTAKTILLIYLDKVQVAPHGELWAHHEGGREVGVASYLNEGWGEWQGSLLLITRQFFLETYSINHPVLLI